ncbi:hypothetical protein WSM22_25680 [Cytophagales bacterium WSM2-2]|nr:hypothetical protein WSM22_25680 [Cytophagales bacterium WSM2-2]
MLLVLVAGAIWSNCSKDNTNVKPFITYVRVTNPTSSDSLLGSAGQGQMIAIIGGNLSSVNQVWFNDQKATLLPTFMTDATIITRVPSQIPGTITNQLKMIFGSGDSVFYDFSVNISKPLIDHVRSEYVNAGDSVFIYGNYFYAPLTVTFTGGVQGQILSIAQDAKSIALKMPSGVQPGPLTITTNFGEKASTFWMQDNRNIIASFDLPFTNNYYVWKGKETGFLISSDTKVPSINGKFCRVNKGALGAYPFLEIYGGVGESGVGDVSTETRNIPQEAFAAPGNYSLKFEINTLAPINGADLRIYIGNQGDNGGNFDAARQSNYYLWQAPIYASSSLNGVWKTVTIPWADVYMANQQFPYSSTGYGIFLYWHGPNPATYNYAMDNIRVVPNK